MFPVVESQSVLVEAPPSIPLYNVYSHRSDRAPMQVNATSLTLVAAKALADQMYAANRYRREPEQFEITPAGERPATMLDLLAQIHELQAFVADLQEQLEEAHA